jgi:hypothetical protein
MAPVRTLACPGVAVQVVTVEEATWSYKLGSVVVTTVVLVVDATTSTSRLEVTDPSRNSTPAVNAVLLATVNEVDPAVLAAADNVVVYVDATYPADRNVAAVTPYR